MLVTAGRYTQALLGTFEISFRLLAGVCLGFKVVTPSSVAKANTSLMGDGKGQRMQRCPKLLFNPFNTMSAIDNPPEAFFESHLITNNSDLF